MDLDQVIAVFESERKGKFGQDDIRVILEVVTHLGIGEFEISRRAEGPEFFKDVTDVLHVHPTMIVAGAAYPGSVDRGPEPYKKWPHFRALENWKGPRHLKRLTRGFPEVLCDWTFNWVPAGRECVCGRFHPIED